MFQLQLHEEISTGISHMVSCPRPAWAFFVILFLFHRFARTFFQSVPVILWHRAVSMPLLAPNAHFLPDAKTPLPCVVFMRLLSLLLHPDNTVANLSRPIPSKMARNNSRGTATSAICRQCLPARRRSHSRNCPWPHLVFGFERRAIKPWQRSRPGSHSDPPLTNTLK